MHASQDKKVANITENYIISQQFQAHRKLFKKGVQQVFTSHGLDWEHSTKFYDGFLHLNHHVRNVICE